MPSEVERLRTEIQAALLRADEENDPGAEAMRNAIVRRAVKRLNALGYEPRAFSL